MPIGPALPPHLQKQRESPAENESKEDNADIGPTLPPHLQKNIGPSVPPHTESTEESERIGPVLPPHLRQNEDSQAESIGPSLPAHLRQSVESTTAGASSIENEPVSDIGPALPPHLRSGNEESDVEEEFGCPLPPPPVKGPSRPPAEYTETDDDDYVVGPAIPAFLAAGGASSTQEELEEAEIEARFQKNSEKMKKKITTGDEKKLEREEWMLELPSVRTGNAIVGGTTFRKHEIAANNFGRSEWTRTPGQKGPSKKEAAEEDRKRIQAFAEYEKNQRMAKELEKAKEATKRPAESLFASHQKKLKKKEKEERKKAGHKKERVAFNRETDMQSTILSDAQKKQMLKKTMGLGGRFSSGGGKFL